MLRATDTSLSARRVAAMGIIAREARREAEEAKRRADEARRLAEAPDVCYPEEYRAQDRALIEAYAEDLADALWEAHRLTPSLLSRIREATCGRMIRPCIGTEGDWRRYCPRSYMRMGRTDRVRLVRREQADGTTQVESQVVRGGVPADEVADMLGFESDDDLLRAIIREAEDGAGMTRAEAMDRAREEARSIPEVAEVLRAHMAEWQALAEAQEAARFQLPMLVEAAEGADAVAARFTAEVVMAARIAAAEVTPRPCAQGPAPLPSRRERKRAAAHGSSLGAALHTIRTAVAAAARRMPGQAVVALAGVAGQVAGPLLAWWEDASRDVAASLGYRPGRHAAGRRLEALRRAA
jgi:hypothetical protein